jgi:N-acetylglucosaminyl-diphospho-decaprenol L-rhamnosyltransferase
LIPTESKEADDVAQPGRADLPLVHAVVVTHRGAAFLGDCLRALGAEASAARLEIVVVDNASQDGTADLLRDRFPSVTVLRMPENVGYGRANNVALRRALAAGADYCALLNDDVEVERGWLATLVETARRHPEAGLLCGTLLFRDAPTVNSTGLEIDRLGRVRDRDWGVQRDELRRPDGPVGGVSGGAALVRCALLRRIGVFDPAYFAYYEDVDLSLRARRAGSICWYTGAALARHRVGATTGPGSPWQRYLLGRGHLRTLALHQPALRAAALVPLAAAWRVAIGPAAFAFRGRFDLAGAELRAGVSGFAAALRALPVRLRGGIPRGAEPDLLPNQP